MRGPRLSPVRFDGVPGTGPLSSSRHRPRVRTSFDRYIEFVFRGRNGSGVRALSPLLGWTFDLRGLLPESHFVSDPPRLCSEPLPPLVCHGPSSRPEDPLTRPSVIRCVHQHVDPGMDMSRSSSPVSPLFFPRSYVRSVARNLRRHKSGSFRSSQSLSSDRRSLSRPLQVSPRRGRPSSPRFGAPERGGFFGERWRKFGGRGWGLGGAGSRPSGPDLCQWMSTTGQPGRRTLLWPLTRKRVFPEMGFDVLGPF